MSIVLWIVAGIAFGMSARTVMPGPDPIGRFGSAGLGIVSAVTGGLVGGLFRRDIVQSFDTLSVLTAVIGSLLVMFCYRAYALRWEIEEPTQPAWKRVPTGSM